MVMPTASRQSKRPRGLLMIDVMFAIAILAVALLPLAYIHANEGKLLRSGYDRAVAMEIVDGEMEVLRAGEWRLYDEGVHPYAVRAVAAKNLPPGRFVLTRNGSRLTLDWLPDTPGKGVRVSRSAIVK
jgi:hypothetical protein